MFVYRPSRAGEYYKILWLVAALILLHFMLTFVLGFPLTLSPLAVVAFLVTAYEFRFPRMLLFVWSLLVLLPLINFGLYISTTDPIEFMKTYSYWIFAVSTVSIASSARLRGRGMWVAKAAFVVLVILTFYSAAQIISFNYFSSDILFNPFGDHQYLYHYDVVLHADSIRAPGFYLEPSYNAFVVTSMLFIVLVSNYRPVISLMLGTVAVLFIQSFAGFLVYGFLLIGYLIMRGARASLWGGLATLLLVSPIVYLSGISEYIGERIASASVEGSSTNYRIAAPLTILRDILRDRVTGVAFGDMEKVLAPYGIGRGDSLGLSLDNGVYLLVFDFGWLAIAVIVVAALIGILFYRGRWSFSTLYLLGYIALSMNYSGAIFVPEYAFVIALAIYAWRANKSLGRGHASQNAAPVTYDLGELSWERGFR
jgi:putative colanic acid polymerase